MSTTPKKGKRQSQSTTKNDGFSAEEKAAMKARARELKNKTDGESAIRAAIAGMTPQDGALAERIHELGAPAVIVTGGHGPDPVDHLFDGREHVEIPVERHDVAATHGAGCTHSATLAALLAHGLTLEDAARGAAEAASRAVANGLTDVGGGDGPVDVLNVRRS